MNDKTPELVLISTNLPGEGCAALLSCLLSVNGPMRITREQYEALPKYYRIEIYSDSDNEADSTIYEARLVSKDTLEPHERLNESARADDIPPELKQLLDAMGAEVKH